MNLQSLKNKFAKLFVHKDEMEPELEIKQTKTWRNRHYRNHFEGYTEVLEPKPGGGSTTKMVYTGEYYRPKTGSRLWTMYKLFYFLLYGLAIALWIISVLEKTAANTLMYVYAPEVLCMCSFLLLLRAIIERAFAPYKMIIREYRTAVKNISLMSVITGILLALSILMVALHMIIARVFLSELKQLVCELCAGVCLFIMYRVEKSIEYEKIDNEDADIKGYKVH